MSIETFDWQGYMSDIGYAPEQIPNEINDEDREWLYGLWARDLMEQLNYEAKQNPFLATSKEKAANARSKFLQYAPDLAHLFGEEVQPNDPNTTYDPEAFRQHVVNNEIQNANLGYYLDTFAASRINEDTDVKWPWLKGLTKDQFKKHFMEQQDIDEAWTSVDDIRNGNFGTLAANYQAQLAQQQGLRGDEKSGHMAALKQGWYEFEKLFGYTAGTLGDATGIQWLSDIGNEIAQNVIQKSDAYNYQSKYNQSLADTIKNEGVMAAGGKILNMAEENWATTAAPLALAAIGKILSTYAHVPQPLADAATRAVAANVVRRQGANLLRRASQLAYGSSAALSGLEIGGVRAELEEHGKYDPNNVLDVVAGGLVSSSLDFIGNVAAMKGLTITASRLWTHKLAVDEARARLAKEIAGDQAKSFTHRVLSAMATEGVTEGLQEIPAMVVGARRGIEYTPKEVRDRIIDAAAVGAFMGAGVRAGEIALEKYHRGDEESPTDTDADETPETPDAPEAPSQPSQPPPPDFDGEMPFNNVTYRPMENGFVAADPFNVGYGATRNEAAEDFLKNANKGRVDIDANDIRSVPPSATEEGSSIVRYGNNGEHSVRIIGQGSNALIRKIIDIHNNPKNAVNLQGHSTFNVSDFQSTNPDLNEDQFIRSVLEQKKTGRGSSNDVILNRTNAVDIPVNLTAVPRTDIAGSYAAFNLDQDTRDALRGKGFTILSNPKSRENGRIQKLLLYRNGFVYTVTLRNSVTDDNVSAVVEAEHIEDINARRQITNKDQNNKARQANIKRNSLEAGVRNQTLRVVTTDPVTDVRSTSERKSSITIAPVLRAGFVELNRRINAEGVEEFTIDPRKILEKRIKDANGKIEKVGARGITYTSGGETTRLDITADGRVVVSTDGRFVGDYEFFDPADITEGERRASFQSTRIEATQPFHVIEIPEELQFDGRVTFVYKGDASTPENQRNYYAIRNNGDVYYISPAEDNYIKRLLRLQYIQNLNDARDVFGNQFIEFYALPEFYEDGEVRQFVGFKTENNLLPVVNLEDPTLHRFSNMEVDDLISAGYNGEFVKVYAIIAPNGEVVRATTKEGVDAFISDIKGYANILDDSEWNPSSRGESIFGDAYTERGLYREEDLYGAGYETSPSGDNVTDDDISKDNEKIREATKKIVDRIGEEIKALRDQYKKGKYHLSNSRISDYESALSDLERDITFSESSTFNYYPGTVREINENLRRRFYAMRTAQAMLHIDLYRNKLGSYTSVLNREELDRVLADTSLTFDENATIEELRKNTIQVESIAVRLEEAYIKTFPLNDSTKLTTLLWQTIYSDPVEGNYGSFVNRIHSEGTDFRFSRAAETPRVRRKDSILNELQKELGDFTLDTMLEKGLRGESGGLVILPDQEAAHDIERRFTTDATQPYYDDEGLIQGFVAPDGMIYLVEDGIVDGKARQIILHEYGVHARKFGMTDAQFQEVVQNIKAKRDEKSLEGDFIRHAITRAKQANKNMSEDNPIFWEEVAAYAVEDGYHLADTGIVGRMQTWMKNWLWRFGVIDATAFHYQDFVNMAQGMLGNPGPLSFFDGTHDYTKYQDSWKNIPKFSRTILAEDTPEREEFAQRTYRRLRGLDDAIDRERNGEDADSIERNTDWRRNDDGDWGIVRDTIRFSRAVTASREHREEFASIDDAYLYLGTGEGSHIWGIGTYSGLPKNGEILTDERISEFDKRYGRKLEEEVVYFNKEGKEYVISDRFHSSYMGGEPDIERDAYVGFGEGAEDYFRIEGNNYSPRDMFDQPEILAVYILNRRSGRKSSAQSELEAMIERADKWIEITDKEFEKGEKTKKWRAHPSIWNGISVIDRRRINSLYLVKREYKKIREASLSALDILSNEFSDEDTHKERVRYVYRGQTYILDIPTEDMMDNSVPFYEQDSVILERISRLLDDLKKEGILIDETNIESAFQFYKVLGKSLYEKRGDNDPKLRNVKNFSKRDKGWLLASILLRDYDIKGMKYTGSGDDRAAVTYNRGDIKILGVTRPVRKGINYETGKPFRYSRSTNERIDDESLVANDFYVPEIRFSRIFSPDQMEVVNYGKAYNGRDYVRTVRKEDTLPQIMREHGVRFVNGLEESAMIQGQYAEAMRRQSDYVSNLNRSLLSRRRFIWEDEGSFIAGLDIRDIFVMSHFAPKGIKGGAKIIKKAAESNMKFVAAVPPYQGNMLEKAGFRFIGEAPMPFHGQLVLKNVYVNKAMNEEDIDFIKSEFTQGRTQEEIDSLINSAKRITGKRDTSIYGLRYSRASAEDLKPYKSFINDLEDNLVRERISGVPREGDTVLYQRGDVNEFITRDSLYIVEDAADYYPDLEQRWIDYHRDDSESNFIKYSRSIPETNGVEEIIEPSEQEVVESAIRYSRVTDPEEIARLEAEPKIQTPLYRAMVLIDGRLYPPMSTRLNGELREGIPVEEVGNYWEKAEENPELAILGDDGKYHFSLQKEIGGGSSVAPLYAPYIHSSPSPLNDQFSAAWRRNLVTVEVQVPESELTSGYTAEKSSKSVGMTTWNAGKATAQLEEGRQVMLSRWAKIVRIVPDSEVAEIIAPMLVGEGKNIAVPASNVTASLRTELEKRGVTIGPPISGAVATAFRRANPELRYSRTIPTGEQNQADVIYPDAREEIQAIRYSRQSAEDILKKKRPGFSPEQVKVVLDELDSYGDDEKKQKLVLHWVVRGQLDLPQDKYKIDPAIKYASSNLGVDPYSLSPQEIINRYQKANPSGTPIRPGRKTSENDETKYIEDEFKGIFTDFKDHGDGIVSYQVEDSREGQEAMRKIMNTHWGKNQSPWCLLYADNQGRLRKDAQKWWNVYNKLPKRVGFKNGDLISFMATEDDPASRMSIEFAINKLKRIMIDFPHRYVNLSSFAEDYARYDDLRKLLINFEVMTDANSSVPEYLTINRENIIFLREELGENVIKFLSQSLREKFKSLFEGEVLRLDLTPYESDIFRSALTKRQNELETLTRNAKKEWVEWVEKKGVDIYHEEILNAKILQKPDGTFYSFHDLNGDGNHQIIIFYKQEDGSYIHGATEITEKWWDRDNESHPNLDWARDHSVHGLRYSRAATIDDVPQTPRQRGTQVPNAPGMYKMPDGSLHIEPSELPVGFESETILYAAIAVSDPAKEEPKIAELRGLILTDSDLMRETDRMMRERNDTNEDHRLGYAVSLILEAYDPTSDIYQQTVDAFHEAVSKATGGAYQNLILDTGQIEAAAHAAAGIPYEALLTAPQETLPTPRPDTADVQRQQLEEAFANSDAQREYMQVGEDGRAFIATDDSDVDVVFESKVTNPFTTGEIADKVLVETTEHNESEDFYNHLADSPTDRTQEPLDIGRFTVSADSNRQEVEAFLASVLPEHIWNRMQILWEDNADNRKLLDNALGKFSPKAWQNKNILIRGWDRSFGQVVRTAGREASRFGWGLWQNRDFRKALTDFYDMFTSPIYNELTPYYNQMGVTDPTKLSSGQKIFMVQTFFSKLNQSLFTDDATNMADILGIDAQEYKRVLANVKRGISAQENDLSRFMSGVAGNPELAKQFAREMLRMTMETATNVGTHFVYERANTLGGKDRIRVYTNEWGTWRNTEPKTRFGKVAKQIKENLEWWHWRYKGNPRAEKFARWMMRNLPMGWKYPMSWFHLYVPDARLGDTTLGKASQMISRVWQRIGDMSGTTIQQDYALMEDIHGILRDYGYDPLVTNDMFDQTGRRITYEQFFRGLGITSAKAMEKARLADEVVRTAEGLRKEQAANIRSMIVETGISLYNRMVNAGVPQRNIEAMVNDFERKRQKFHDNYAHRMYEAFTPEGKSELARMLHYLKRDPATGELTIAKRARQAEEKIRQAEARYGRGTSQFYKETAEARADLRRYERLTHLQNFVKAVLRDKKRLFGAELNEAVVAAMKNTINTIILDAQSIGRIDAQAVPHYNSISAQKARKLNPENDVHRELMAFLSEIKDPMRVAVYSADQQRQIIAKLQFNKELGEYLVDNGMATIRGVPSAEGIARDLAQMESGTFLEYINVDPAFMPEIKAEYENMQKVTETVLGGLTDAVKANSTVYSLRLAMNNYIGNASMLLASGHFWRFGNWMEAGGIVRKQFLDRFTYGAKDPSDFGKMIIKEMEAAMVTGGSGTEMSVFQLNKGAHENFVQMMTGLLYSGNLLSRAGKFKADNFVKRALEYARKFYTYGDEWVKPLMYINNRMNAIAKYEAIEKRRNGETEEEYQERVLKKAIEEASEMTIRETVSWENSPFFVRQLSTKSTRFFVPDFLLHNFQMLRITASNYVRLMELGKELANFNPTQMNPDKVDAYRSALMKEFVQRGVGGAMTAGVYAGLAGATGSCMAFIPYMMNTLMAAIDGEDDKDKDNTFFNPQQWEGAQRILNYKTGGDNFFVPAWKHNGKIYAWNYGRASVMLTHAIPQPATENPEFTDYAAQFFKNIVNIGGGTIAQEIVNNAQGKDKWGREIGMEAGWGRIFDRVIVPGAVRQLLDMSVGYPGSSDNPYREGKAIKMSDAVGITVNAYDMRDIVNEVGWNMGRVGSNSQNVVRKSFVKRLTESDALSDSQIASLVSDMRESNARDFDKANYVLTGLRQMGMENKEIAHWLTVSRKDANPILSGKQANAFLKGQNIYDENLVTYLKNRRNNLAKGQDDVRMSKEELAVVLQNYDKAIRIYSQALRTN